MSDPGNAMMAAPQGPASPQTDSMSGPQPPDMNGLLPHMEAGLNQNAQQYKKIQQVMGQAQVIRTQLDELVKMGDLVTTEDLVHHASKLVAHGIGAAGDPQGILVLRHQGVGSSCWLDQHSEGSKAPAGRGPAESNG